MKCYYEELSIQRNANDGDIKSAYRKMALRWHPDKNLENLEEAKVKFQLIQQAYEVLSDPQERAWYDNHREQILRGRNSEYADNCLDVFEYFTVSCFKGYDDSEKGFYSVYREVFEKIIAEDAEFIDDNDVIDAIPRFGDSQSNFEEVVAPFYSHWIAYSTKKTYTWLSPYNIQEVRGRRILRELDKDMKKIVQKARKERNEEVRNLVSYVRKRDKRFAAYNAMIGKRNEENKLKAEKVRQEHKEKRQQLLKEALETKKETNNDEYEILLQGLENQYTDNSNDEIEDEENDSNDESELLDNLYCVACNKSFKNVNMFHNHELSKKHRENVERLKQEMTEEEEIFQKDVQCKSENGEANNSEIVDTSDEEPVSLAQPKKSKKKAKKSKNKSNINAKDLAKDEDGKEEENTTPKSFGVEIDESNSDNEHWNIGSSKKKGNKKNKSKNIDKKTANKTNIIPNDNKPNEPPVTIDSDDRSSPEVLLTNVYGESSQPFICEVCRSGFPSKNKLFTHLKDKNHSIYVPKTSKGPTEVKQSKKNKAKQK